MKQRMTSRRISELRRDHATRSPPCLVLVLLGALTLSGMLVDVAQATEYFVKPGSQGGDDGNTGFDWDNALATVTTAVFKADSTIVTVRAGTYDQGAQIALNKAITVRSEVGGLVGAAVTTVRRTGGTAFRIFSLSHADACVEGLTISGGVDLKGGGAYMTAGTVRDCVVTGNATSSTGSNNAGGGIWASGGVIQNAVITNNAVNGSYNQTGFGGGVSLEGTALMEGCLIAHNEVSVAVRSAIGGGLYMNGASVIVRNCLIRNNKVEGSNSTSKFGGGVSIANGLLENCTVVSNQAVSVNSTTAGTGGGVYRTGGTVRNSIIFFNTAITADNNYSGAAANLSYSCTDPLVVNTGNIAETPIFVDAGAGDYRLRFESPGVDAGLNDPAWMTDGTDFDGNDRLSNSTVDMGAYEYEYGAAFAARFSAPSGAVGYLGLTDLVLEAELDGSGAQTQNVVCVWTIGNQKISGTDRLAVTNTFTPGSYTVSLAVTNEALETYEVIRAGYIRVGAEAIHVASGGTAVYPYSSVATAATNFPAAHAAIRDMQSIGAPVRAWVHDGDWAVDRTVGLTGDSIVRSVNGPDNASIYRPESLSSFRVASLSHADAIMEGLTISGGVDLKGGGIRMTAGTVTNCVVTGNATIVDMGNDNSGAGIWASGGSIRNSVMTSNIVNGVYNQTGYGGGVYLEGTARMDGCLIAHNAVSDKVRHAYGGGLYMSGASVIVRNCLIRNNRVVGTWNQRGGGVNIAGGLLECCTVVTNLAVAGNAPVGGGVYRSGGDVRNSIIYFNTATTDNNYSGAAANLTYSCTDPLVANTGNIDSNPQFADVPTDCRLKTGSDCIDAGHPGPYMGDLDWIAMPDARDLGGEPRFLNKAVDMGAFETLIPPRGTTFLIW